MLSLQLLLNSLERLLDFSPNILNDLIMPIPSAKSKTSSVSDSLPSCFVFECSSVVFIIRFPTITNAIMTANAAIPKRISITNIMSIIKPWEIIKVTSSDKTPIQHSSINTMSVHKTALIFPIFPSVKYPIGSFLR